ncbi:hypothetical protein BX666DRAFT_2023447 [Dichotomocladium elegans]|nr:hypothetical protein BX666DRAFT_2023447 [Dichotomocladium elegans]
MKQALEKSLERLNDRLLQARAQLRRAKINADAKRALVAESEQMLQRELADAFTVEIVPKRKRPRLLPPPGLVPLLQQQQQQQQQQVMLTDSTSGRDDESEPPAALTVVSSLAWVRGVEHDTIWIQIEIENPSNVSACQIAPILAPATVLPASIRRTTIGTLAPGQTAMLYASFHMLDHTDVSQLARQLNVGCSYTTEDDAWHSSDFRKIQWATDTNDDMGWIPHDIEKCMAALVVFFPDRASMSTVGDRDAIKSIKELLELQHPLENVHLYHTYSQDVVLVQTESGLLNMYGLTIKALFRAVRRLQQEALVQDVTYNPPVPLENDVRDLLVALQDEVGYLEDRDARENPHTLIAARENTLSLLNNVLQTHVNKL